MARGSSMAEMLLMANHRRKVALALNGETPSLAVHTEFAVPVGGRREHTIRVKTRLIPLSQRRDGVIGIGESRVVDIPALRSQTRILADGIDIDRAVIKDALDVEVQLI